MCAGMFYCFPAHFLFLPCKAETYVEVEIERLLLVDGLNIGMVIEIVA